MIGFYNYTVILTYIGLVSSVFGMTQAIGGHYKTAVACLAFSGLCDMFDGKIARSKKDRTDDEKLFGVQLDSLCDVICFGVFPAMLCWVMGMQGVVGSVIISYYSVCSVIRLAFFNVLETNRQRVEEGANKYYHGLPITTISVILPIVFLTSFVINRHTFILVLAAMLIIVGTLFIIDFKLKKPNNIQLFIMVIVVAVAVLITYVHSRYKIKMHISSFNDVETFLTMHNVKI